MMKAAEKTTATLEIIDRKNGLIDNTNPIDTLEHCQQALQFLGDSIPAFQHSGIELEQDNVMGYVMLMECVKSALEDATEKLHAERRSSREQVA